MTALALLVDQGFSWWLPMLAFILAALASGCTEAPAADPPPLEDNAPAGDARPTASRSPPADDESVLMLPPWNSSRMVLFDGTLTATHCPVWPGTFDERLSSASVAGLCAAVALPADAFARPGLASFHLTISAHDAALDGVDATVITHRGDRLEGKRIFQDPFEWRWDIAPGARHRYWSLPDHEVSGYRLLLSSETSAAADQPLNVSLSIQVAEDWQGASLAAPFKEDGAPAFIPFIDTAVTAEATAGTPRERTGVGFLRSVPVGAQYVSLVTRWTEPADCPPLQDCMPWLFVGSDKSMHDLTSVTPAAQGASWRVDVLETNVFAAPFWTEVDDFTGHVVEVDAAACPPPDDSCSGVSEFIYSGTYSIDVLMSAEAWPGPVDLEGLLSRYGLS